MDGVFVDRASNGVAVGDGMGVEVVGKVGANEDGKPSMTSMGVGCFGGVIVVLGPGGVEVTCQKIGFG